MSADVFKLLDRLQAEWIEPLTAGEDDIEALLGRRQEILAELQSLDAQLTDPSVRATVSQRLQSIAARDHELVTALQERMHLVSEQLATAAQGRAAVRGYRAPEDADPKLFIRPA